MEPKPLSNAVQRAFSYLIEQQSPAGGWSQGGGWRSSGTGGGRVEGPNVEDPPDVANTAVATLALLRGGHTPRAGDYAANVQRALDFVMSSVETSPEETPFVTEQRDTQVQSKIGPLVDTFLATQVLAEARGQMPNEDSEARLGLALHKCIRKMQQHQGADGAWAMHGWAPVVGQSLGATALNRARQKGADVSEETLERAGKFSRSHYNVGTKSFAMGGSAGVPLYAAASHLSSSTQSIDAYQSIKRKLHRTTADTNTPKEEVDRATAKLNEINQEEQAHAASVNDQIAGFSDPRFLSGFGSNGGEEFLSYLNISETLRAKGGDDWTKWDQSITESLERIQNGDGSWAGHHCITGRTFCTATALLVLLADRAPAPETVHA